MKQNRKCLNCEKLLNRRAFHNRKYCSQECKIEYNKSIVKEKWDRCFRCKKRQTLLLTGKKYCDKCRKEVIKETYEKNKSSSRKFGKMNYYKNRNNKKWKKKVAEQSKRTLYKKYHNDPNYRITVRLRSLLSDSLRHYTNTKKLYKSEKYGINYGKIIRYLQPLPKDMENYEIHHIKPLVTFNFINKDGSTNLDEVRKAFAPENHKLVTKKEHREEHKKLKSDKS